MICAAAYRFVMGSNKLHENGRKKVEEFGSKNFTVLLPLAYHYSIFILQFTLLKHNYLLQSIDRSPIYKYLAQGHHTLGPPNCQDFILCRFP